jgi:asparagine synthase (glutamine-hydrolysing)
MATHDQRYWITFNGEIYNFLELRAELEGLGYAFRSASDTEVILAAYEAWGPECQLKFNGMWAFAIWDNRDKALFLARDRFGKKPLFYAYLPNGDIAFASEMKAIFPLLGQIRPNKPLIQDPARILNYEATEECVIEGIYRFPAGHCATVSNGRLVVRRWWNTLDHLPKVSERYDDQVEQFRELFIDACRLRMRSDVPLGTALSGGLDSSATISCMAYVAGHGQTKRMGESWQHAFVASFPGTSLDEVRYARKVTDALDIESTIIEIDPVKGLSRLDEYLYLFEDMFISSPIPFMQTYEAVKTAGVSVTLDGHGADELFGGYPFDCLHAMSDAGVMLGQSRMIAETYHNAYGTNGMGNNAKLIAKWHLRRLLGRADIQNSKDSEHPAYKDLGRLNQQLYASTHDTILPTLLRNYDRYSMASGVEIRMPFMDHRLVSFAFSIPWDSKVRNGYTKAIVRDALSPFMPRDIAYRKTKIGFHSPMVDWMKGPLRQFMLDTVDSRSFRECELVDSQTLASDIKRTITSSEVQFSDGERIWAALSPYLWERAVIHGQGMS